MNALQIYTDGASRGNGNSNSLSSWACILVDEETQEVLDSNSEGVVGETNNAMELTGVIRGIELAQEYCLSSNIPLEHLFKFEVLTDSSYVVNAINKGWLRNWERDKFLNKGIERPNTQLWIELINLLNMYDNIVFTHVRGHASCHFNNEADRLCNERMDEMN